MQSAYFYEGTDWLDLYKKNPDPCFIPMNLAISGHDLDLFHGRIPLSFWLKAPIPLPSVPVTFWGSPVTDLFPPASDSIVLRKNEALELIHGVVSTALQNHSWAVVVKDLPEGHPLGQSLAEAGFTPIDHDPIWYMPVPDTLQAYLNGLSKGRRRGLEGRWRKFFKYVHVRPAEKSDTGFIKDSYDVVRMRSPLRLERLTADFFSNSLLHPRCKLLIFEEGKRPFAFLMIWQKDNMWFDKYMGTDTSTYRKFSFYSMSILYLLQLASSHGIKTYIAGQGSGMEKAELGFKGINVKLWVKPLALRFLADPILKRFIHEHDKRIYNSKC